MARPSLFTWRHFASEIIVCGVRWYLRSALSYRDVEELLRERGGRRRSVVYTTAAGRSQAHIAAALAKDATGQLAYDLSRQAWMAYDHGRWQPHETERVTQRIMARMDDVLQGDYTWHACAGVEHLLRARLAQTLPLETPGWLPFRNGALHLATMQLHPHSPERPFTWQLPHAYDPQATCPQTLAWLHEAVGDAHDQVQVLRAYAKAVVTRRVDLLSWHAGAWQGALAPEIPGVLNWVLALPDAQMEALWSRRRVSSVEVWSGERIGGSCGV
jgi:hypothetical protein